MRNEEVARDFSKTNADSHGTRVSHGIVVVNTSAMMKTRKRSDPIRLLRWVFRRGEQALTCQLERGAGSSAFYVALVPHWDVKSAVIETFNTGVTAFERHAAIAAHLRSNGWTVIAHVAAA